MASTVDRSQIVCGAIVRIPAVVGRELHVDVWVIRAIEISHAQMCVVVDPWLTTPDARMTVPWTAITEVIAPPVTASATGPLLDPVLSYCLSHPAASSLQGPAPCTAGKCTHEAEFTVVTRGGRRALCSVHCSIVLRMLDQGGA